DGETAAGGRLLHLMEILNVKNVMVVVSRWYGGILLGPDRFKHINNCARNILVEKNYTNSPEESSKALGKNKKMGIAEAASKVCFEVYIMKQSLSEENYIKLITTKK
ncbi:IMPACT isoform 2, partial [Pongo abelii]